MTHTHEGAQEGLSPWQGVPASLWNDWRWQMAHRLRSARKLGELVGLSEDEIRAGEMASERFPVGVTPYYASLMSRTDRSCPIRLQSVPQAAELCVAAGEMPDPLAEDAHMPSPGLTHRYPDRALMFATHVCPTYCRHCLRRRKVGDHNAAPSRPAWEAAFDYLEHTREIRDVIVSGGDPLCLSDRRLVDILRRLRAIPHVEIIRVATRCPATLPQRITAGLAAAMARFAPIYLLTQFNHPAECTPEAANALALLADAGLVLANQMVLLAGVNDNVESVRRLNHWLLAHRCWPYYIHQCDAAEGIRHFRTPVARGIQIIEGLRGHTSGLAVPHYVVDLPGGGGKVSMQPDYLLDRSKTTLTFRSFSGGSYTCQDG
ncbi:KamA family radical SAM protein [Myxococcota bacterium]